MAGARLGRVRPPGRSSGVQHLIRPRIRYLREVMGYTQEHAVDQAFDDLRYGLLDGGNMGKGGRVHHEPLVRKRAHYLMSADSAKVGGAFSRYRFAIQRAFNEIANGTLTQSNILPSGALRSERRSAASTELFGVLIGKAVAQRGARAAHRAAFLRALRAVAT